MRIQQHFFAKGLFNFSNGVLIMLLIPVVENVSQQEDVSRWRSHIKEIIAFPHLREELLHHLCLSDQTAQGPDRHV